jgi:hypothetical protein
MRWTLPSDRIHTTTLTVYDTPPLPGIPVPPGMLHLYETRHILIVNGTYEG